MRFNKSDERETLYLRMRKAHLEVRRRADAVALEGCCRAKCFEGLRMPRGSPRLGRGSTGRDVAARG